MRSHKFHSQYQALICNELYVRNNGTTGGVGSSGDALDPDDPQQGDHAQLPSVAGAGRRPQLGAAHLQRPRVGPRLVHVPSQHRPHALPKSLRRSRRYVDVVHLATLRVLFLFGIASTPQLRPGLGMMTLSFRCIFGGRSATQHHRRRFERRCHGARGRQRHAGVSRRRPSDAAHRLASRGRRPHRPRQIQRCFFCLARYLFYCG